MFAALRRHFGCAQCRLCFLMAAYRWHITIKCGRAKSPYGLNEMIFRNGVEVPRRLAGNSPCGMPDVVTSSLFLAVPLREDFHKVELQNHL